MENKGHLKETKSPEKPPIFISSPTGEKPAKITEEDVWGKWNNERSKRLDKGMVIARTGENCPHFNDVLDYKEVTAVCKKEDFESVLYWLEYVHGTGCVEKTMELESGKVAIRSAYNA